MKNLQRKFRLLLNTFCNIPTQSQIFTYRIKSDCIHFKSNLLMFLIQYIHLFQMYPTHHTSILSLSLCVYVVCISNIWTRNYPKHVIQIKVHTSLSIYQL